MSTVVSSTKGAKPWKLNVPRKEHYSTNEVIDAYLKGKEVGKVDGLKEESEATKQLFVKALTENLTKASGDTHKVLDAFKSQQLKTIEALLRIDSWHRFSVMIVAEGKAFRSEKLLKVYEVVNALEGRETTDQYGIRFSFVAGGKDLDSKALEADGYVLKLKN
ncbi:MAG TPA: hypothetical protein PKD45_02605 [Flavobacteriales bacterium]|nr:hypothetical protein [Flavobacteriales bacterium]